MPRLNRAIDLDGSNPPFGAQKPQLTLLYLPPGLFLPPSPDQDGVRMWSQWKEQSNYINHHWGCGSVLSNMFVIYNLFGQLIPSILVLARKYVKIKSCLAGLCFVCPAPETRPFINAKGGLEHNKLKEGRTRKDGVRMWSQWKEQSNYINHHWGCGSVLSNMFVIYNLFGQLIPSILVLARKYVKISVGLLFGVVFIQTVGYGILFDVRFLLRNVALLGGLVLLLAESMGETKSMFAGVPTLGENRPQNYMQLAGRVLICLMFLTLLGEMSFNNVFTELVRAVELIVSIDD
eukprot:sb/3467620/